MKNSVRFLLLPIFSLLFFGFVAQAQHGIGTATPNSNTILDLSNTESKTLLLPQVNRAGVSSATAGMFTYDPEQDNAYLHDGNEWMPLGFKAVTNEMIFDDATNNLIYISMQINGKWKVIKYNKQDPNDQTEATESNNSGQTTQPTDLATCQGLTYS